MDHDHLKIARRVLGAILWLVPAGLEAEPLRLVTAEKHERYMKFLPTSDNAFLASLKHKDIVWFGDVEMPPAYQHGGGVHSPDYNISAAKPFEPHGNANKEFPWGRTAGLEHTSASADALRFAIFPPGSSIRWRIEGNTHVWSYPEGMVFGECLILKDPDGYWHTFEVRTRQKIAGKWHPNVFRPFRSPVELASQVRALAPSDSAALALAAYLEGGRTAHAALVANGHPMPVFSRWGFSDSLPPIPAKLVSKLLDQPFRSVASSTWLESEQGTACFAPTTDAEYHVVPKGYRAETLRVSTHACMDCHRTTLVAADTIQPGRDWYGRVRGSDGIFSFHIFEPNCISGNGYTRQPVLRRELVRAGLLRHWND